MADEDAWSSGRQRAASGQGLSAAPGRWEQGAEVTLHRCSLQAPLGGPHICSCIPCSQPAWGACSQARCTDEETEAPLQGPKAREYLREEWGKSAWLQRSALPRAQSWARQPPRSSSTCTAPRPFPMRPTSRGARGGREGTLGLLGVLCLRSHSRVCVCACVCVRERGNMSELEEDWKPNGGGAVERTEGRGGCAVQRG